MTAQKSSRMITIKEFAYRAGIHIMDSQMIFKWDRSLKTENIGERKFTTEAELIKFCDYWKIKIKD